MTSRRRDTELGLLVVVAVVIVAGYVLVGLGEDATVPTNVGGLTAVVCLVFGVVHLVNRRYAPDTSATLLPLTAMLNGLGFVIITRVRPSLAWQQALWTVIAVAGYSAVLVFLENVRTLDRYRWTAALCGLVLLALPAVPGLGARINGAQVWVKIPGLGQTFQPGEGAKLCLVVFFASYLVEKRELLALGRRWGPVTIPEFRHFGPLLIAWAIAVVTGLYQSDLGMSLLFFALFLSMLWVATGRGSYLGAGLTLFLAGAVAVWKAVPRVQVRVDNWLNPWADPQGNGYQILQGHYLMAAGGVLGSGLALSGSLQVLPEAESDFIFAVIAGELGLPGALAVIAGFILIVSAGIGISLRAVNPFEKLLAVGIAAIIGFQAFIILAGVTRLLPLTGVALPFITYGGSSLLINYVLMAILVRLSDQVNRENVPVENMVPVGPPTVWP